MAKVAGALLAILVGVAVGLVNVWLGEGWAIFTYLVGVFCLVTLTFSGAFDA